MCQKNRRNLSLFFVSVFGPILYICTLRHYELFRMKYQVLINTKYLVLRPILQIMNPYIPNSLTLNPSPLRLALSLSLSSRMVAMASSWLNTCTKKVGRWGAVCICAQWARRQPRVRERGIDLDTETKTEVCFWRGSPAVVATVGHSNEYPAGNTHIVLRCNKTAKSLFMFLRFLIIF